MRGAHLILLSVAWLVQAQTPPLRKTALTAADRQEWARVLPIPHDCSYEPQPDMGAGITFHRLAAGRYVVDVVCELYAYQGSHVLYLYDENTTPPKVKLLSPPSFSFEAEGKPPVREPSPRITGETKWLPGSNRLTVFQRFRGPGDCGSLHTYEFAANEARLVDLRAKSRCDGREISDPATLPRVRIPR